MLHLRREQQDIQDRNFRDLPAILREGDLVVFNNSRVFPARLFGKRETGAGKIEVLLARQFSREPNEWEALVRPGRKIGVGERMVFGDQNELCAEVVTRGEFGERRIRFAPVPDFFGQVEALGHVPLPPYIDRTDTIADRERYQTIYAQERGSAAAPTAGLHFTQEILGQLRQRSIETAEVTLHVGLGTFQPVRVENVEEHRIHAESYSITEPAAAAINSAVQQSRRVVAIGTTTLRALEHNALMNKGSVAAGESLADLFIYPGFQFQVVKALLTNFHLPQSTLLMLVCAFAGTPFVLEAYRLAVNRHYRFYSYGDCMLIE